MFTSKWSFELSREWHFSYLVNSCCYRTTISIGVLWVSVPDENLTKCTLLVQRSPQALIDYYTMLFPPPTSLIRQSMQERVDMIIIKVQSITNHFFMKGKQNISSLHKIICSLVSLFLWYIMKVVAACKVSSVFNHISPSFLKTNFILKKKNIKFNKFSTPYGGPQKVPWYFLVRMNITPVT